MEKGSHAYQRKNGIEWDTWPEWMITKGQGKWPSGDDEITLFPLDSDHMKVKQLEMHLLHQLDECSEGGTGSNINLIVDDYIALWWICSSKI